MQDLAKILLIPKGDYTATTAYESLDIVNHNGASWVCKKDCTGQEPSDSNTEFWQRFGTAVDLSNFLPLTGGTIESYLETMFGIRNTNSDTSSVRVNMAFLVRDVLLGLFGFSADASTPYPYVEINGARHKLLHTGNKPTGTYTGNGDATRRTIATGGIGEVCLVYSANGVAIVTNTGTTIIPKSGDASYTQDVYLNSAGTIVMASDNVVVNESGATLRYQVL